VAQEILRLRNQFLVQTIEDQVQVGVACCMYIERNIGTRILNTIFWILGLDMEDLEPKIQYIRVKCSR